ncbi:MAG: hypothetical protein H0W71_08735 [Sphingomonas sp.]|nr:hypothetical protein [Sphingomonas sp.]
MKYLHADKNGRLLFRRTFPEALRPWIPGQKRELVRTLAAKSIDALGAIDRYRRALDEFKKCVAAAKKAAAGTFDNLDAPTIAYLAEAFFVESLESDDASRWATGDEREARWAEKTAETLDGILPLYRHLQALGDLEGIVELWTEEAQYFSQARGLRFDADSAPFADLCRALNEASIRTGEAKLQRLDGALVTTPAPPEPVKAPTANGSSRTFDALVRQEMDRPTFSGSATTKQSWKTALRYFDEVRGQPRPEEITRAQVTEFADLLALAPIKRKAKSSERGWPLPKLIEAYEGKHVERLSWKTRAALIGALQAAWNRCQRSGQIANHILNPFASPSLGKAPARRSNDGLSRQGISAIFGLPVFTVSERPNGGKGEACYWLPMLLFTTGAQPEELAQMLVSDVGQDAGVAGWSLTITAEGEHPHKKARNLKTPSAERVIPLPEIVIELGFLDYVAWLKRAGERALFPALRTKGARGELFAGFGMWWGAYLRKHGALPQGKRPAREFRPTWATIARESRIPREAQEYIMGHAPLGRDMNARYGAREPLGCEVQKLSFDGWGLAAVERWHPPSE